MLILESTDELQVTTSAGVTVDVHASYMDYVTGGPTTTPGRKNTAISTAATTTVVTSPAGGSQRNVKLMTIRNKDASPVDVTVQHDDGSTVAELKKVTLAPGDELHYVEGLGFLML